MPFHVKRNARRLNFKVIRHVRGGSPLGNRHCCEAATSEAGLNSELGVVRARESTEGRKIRGGLWSLG